MKKIILFVVTLLNSVSCLWIMSSCQKNESLTDREKTQILTVYENTYNDPYGTVDLYYGKYNGYIVFEMMSPLPAEKIIEIAGCIFLFPSENELWTFKNNSLVLLEKVYDRGDLTDKDIKNIHKRYLQEIKKSKENYEKWYEEYLQKAENYKKSDNKLELKSYWCGFDTRDIKEVWNNLKGETCKIDYRLGKYNYSFVFMQIGTAEESKTIKMEEYTFSYPKDFMIWVYKDRDIILKEEIISLEEAYKKGYITKDNLKKIYDIYVLCLN